MQRTGTGTGLLKNEISQYQPFIYRIMVKQPRVMCNFNFSLAVPWQENFHVPAFR